MAAGKRLMAFGGGSLLGAAIGAVVAGMLAPQRGAELRRQAHDILDEARREGDRAAEETREALASRFRGRVNDPAALRGEGAEV
jgi:gas vesicle protein